MHNCKGSLTGWMQEQKRESNGYPNTIHGCFVAGILVTRKGEEMKITIDINMDNAAFEESGAEVARILRKLAERLYDPQVGEGGKLQDINGNTVGQWEVIE